MRKSLCAGRGFEQRTRHTHGVPRQQQSPSGRSPPGPVPPAARGWQRRPSWPQGRKTPQLAAFGGTGGRRGVGHSGGHLGQYHTMQASPVLAEVPQCTIRRRRLAHRGQLEVRAGAASRTPLRARGRWGASTSQLHCATVRALCGCGGAAPHGAPLLAAGGRNACRHAAAVPAAPRRTAHFTAQTHPDRELRADTVACPKKLACGAPVRVQSAPAHAAVCAALYVRRKGRRLPASQDPHTGNTILCNPRCLLEVCGTLVRLRHRPPRGTPPPAPRRARRRGVLTPAPRRVPNRRDPPQRPASSAGCVGLPAPVGALYMPGELRPRAHRPVCRRSARGIAGDVGHHLLRDRHCGDR